MTMDVNIVDIVSVLILGVVSILLLFTSNCVK